MLTVSNDILSFKILLKFKTLLDLLNNCLFDDGSSVNPTLKFKLLLALLSNSLFNDIFSTLDVENDFSDMKSE